MDASLNTAAVVAATTFLTTLFAETDIVLFRPIESWIENGRKKSLVDYKHTSYRVGKRDVIAKLFPELLRESKAAKTNVFFGTCPRFGDKGRYDLAWQIRIVRVLWADIDNVTPDEALARVAKAGLPPPSIVVCSGNGVHLYWILDEPYLIDDVGDPLPVETEFIPGPGGRKKPQKYIVDAGEKIYLDKRQSLSRLSPKAEHVQNILAGIAKAIGGDHTTDLARLLRIPGTLNRKDERNGREPVPCNLVECDGTRRYGLGDFERFTAQSPGTERVKKIQAMPLPKVRKPTAKRADNLADLAAASRVAAVGNRSEADFALCVFAVKWGIDKELVWHDVQQVGKFAEAGRRYFDLTWESAEFQCRSDKYDKITGTKRGKRSKHEPNRDPADELSEGGDRPTIEIDPVNVFVADTMHEITDHLVKAKNCYLRCEQLVSIRNDAITTVLTPPELQGLLNQYVEFLYVGDGACKYKPLTPEYCNTWLNHHLELSRLPEIKLFTRNPVFTEDWRLVSPGFDAASGIYYAGPVVTPREARPTLDALLFDFCFKSVADRTNYIGLLLTILLIPHFIGSKPAGLFNGNQPNIGKSILAQLIAILRDGYQTRTVTYNPNDEEFEKRLGAIVRRGATTIIVDNAKGHGRRNYIDSACLERSITDAVLSFRLLGHSEEIRAENSHIFCITVNTAQASADLVSRSLVINLEHEGDPMRRKFQIANPESFAIEHRLELLGELIGMVLRWRAAGMRLANVNSRFNKQGWGNIIGGILEANGEPDFLANAEEAAIQLDETRREFGELVTVLAGRHEKEWTATALVEIAKLDGLLCSDLGLGTSRAIVTRFGTIAGRYLNERFRIGKREFLFTRRDGRNGHLYRVTETSVFAEPAEPMGNLPQAQVPHLNPNAPLAIQPTAEPAEPFE